MIEERPFEQFISTANRRTLAAVIGFVLAIVGSVIGLMLAVIGPLYGFVLLIALAGAMWAVWKLDHALWAVVAVIALLPFATLPVKIVLTPTFLDLAMAAVLFLYVMQWMTGERWRFATTPVHPFIILFMLLAVFSFVAGLRYAGLTSNVARKFAEMLLSISFAMLLVDVLRTYQQLRRFALAVVLAGSAAAFLGIALWLLPDQLAESLLVRLSIVGYPAAGALQYIEQNPELSERAISTSVNPNSLGGLLVMVAALAAPQLLTEHPLTGKQWHAIPLITGLVTCLVLTFSRGSMAAFGIAALFIAGLRYRRLLIVLGLIALLILILPWSQPYIERFVAGAQGEDLATQMRMGEYSDALTLISRYPLFGAGFSGAPDIDIYLGVSSVYLLMAENMGLLGLGTFIVLTAAMFAYAWRARPHLDRVPGLRPIWLGALAALIGALTGGVLDHYFVNIEFHHAVTIFWLFVGMLLAATRIALDAAETDRSSQMAPPA